MKELMKARKKDTPVKPPANLETREGDFALPPLLYLACQVFKRLRTKPNTDKFPGTLRLRRYDAGEEICRQGDPGWTAFVILSSDDLVAMQADRDRLLKEVPAKVQKATDARREAESKRDQAIAAGNEAEAAKHEETANDRAKEASDAQKLLEALQTTSLPQPLGGSDAPAEVLVDPRRSAAPSPRGLLARLFSRAEPVPSQRTVPLAEGAMFGQWSCIYGTPRSATIRAKRPCYALEMLRNVLDSILRDAQFQEHTDREYVTSILDNHLAGLPIFREMTPDQLAEVRSSVRLARYRDGQVICDKGDPSESVYIVWRGLVKVLLNDWPLLSPDDIRDWGALAALAREGGPLAERLDDAARTALRLDSPAPRDRAAALAGVNRLLKDQSLTTVENVKLKKREPAPALKPILDQPEFKQIVAAEFPRDSQDWSDRDWRRYNRLVLHSACPGAMRELRLSGSENILTYLTQGDFFGEMGVMNQEPRSATCVAYVHPRPEADEFDPASERYRREERIEMVEIPGELFRRLAGQSPAIQRRVKEEIAARKGRDQRRATRGWEDRTPPQQSDRFQELGLIQGQKLMLIDLDRCTRCDECVEACVAEHDDGRARLFLDGPRFGQYLVPTTCRACRDPVCMIGCPVGSIRRGDNLQIVIENWCIGCEMCAKNCPYGSIQMHDLGLIHQETHGWTMLPRTGVRGDGWTWPGFNDRAWRPVVSPFWWDRDQPDFANPATLCFRREFRIDTPTLVDAGYKLVIDSQAKEITRVGDGRNTKVTAFLPVWINGTPAPAGWEYDRGQYVLELTGDDRKLLRLGRNALGVEATPLPGHRAILLQLALDEIRTSGAVLPLQAVVCDQCSELPGRSPACVHACPHDAARRVDAWTDFPA